MAELPVLPIIVAALLADTMYMNSEQFGAYVRILLAMWGNGAELRDCDSELAQIAGVSLKRWLAIREAVLRPVSIIDGMLYQKRLSDTWDKVQRLRVKRTSASNERWHRERLRNAHAYPNEYAKGHQVEMQVDMQTASTTDPSAMHMESNSKLKDKLTSTSVGTARAREDPTKSITATDDLAEIIRKKGWIPS